MKIDPNAKYQLLVPVEALALVSRAFSDSRKVAVQRMLPKELIREITRALRTLVKQPKSGQRFAIGDIVQVKSAEHI